MKYEIKIISEEDTVKSKVYDDLDKAIEIAERMLNDFVNTDFGDEVIITEANNYKPSKYLWANGKKLNQELKIGDKVIVVDNGAIYSSYYDFMLTYGTKQDCLGWTYGNSPLYNTTYEVVHIADHLLRPQENKLAIIKEVENVYTPKTYIIGLRGLQKI